MPRTPKFPSSSAFALLTYIHNCQLGIPLDVWNLTRSKMNSSSLYSLPPQCISPSAFYILVNGIFIHPAAHARNLESSLTPLSLTPNLPMSSLNIFAEWRKSQFHCFFFRDKGCCKAANLDEMLHYILFIASYVFLSQHFSCCIIMWSFALTFICHARLHEGRRIRQGSRLICSYLYS